MTLCNVALYHFESKGRNLFTTWSLAATRLEFEGCHYTWIIWKHKRWMQASILFLTAWGVFCLPWYIINHFHAGSVILWVIGLIFSIDYLFHGTALLMKILENIWWCREQLYCSPDNLLFFMKLFLLSSLTIWWGGSTKDSPVFLCCHPTSRMRVGFHFLQLSQLIR